MFEKLLVMLLILFPFLFKILVYNYHIDNQANLIKSRTNWNEEWQNFSDVKWVVIHAVDVICISGDSTSKIYIENIVIPNNKSDNLNKPITISINFRPQILILDSLGNRYYLPEKYSEL